LDRQFDEKFTDIFSFQDSIAARVASALSQALSEDQSTVCAADRLSMLMSTKHS